MNRPLTFEQMQARLAAMPAHGPRWWHMCEAENARNPLVGSAPFEPDTDLAKQIMDDYYRRVREREGERSE